MYKHFSIISLLNDNYLLLDWRLIYKYLYGYYWFFIFYAVHYYLTSVMVVVFQGVYKYRIKNDITSFEIPILLTWKRGNSAGKFKLFVSFRIFHSGFPCSFKIKEWQFQKQFCHSLYYYFYAYPMVHYFFQFSGGFLTNFRKRILVMMILHPLMKKELKKCFSSKNLLKE